LPSQLVLVRHGETEWTITGQHTGRTDIPLTSNGREEARRVGSLLVGRTFAWVLSSPLTRALETCRLAGMGEAVETTDDLMEWDYGQYEGLTTAEIRKGNPRWSLWLDGAPGGETASDVAVRVDTVIKEAREQDGDVLVFAHGHVLRVLAARWLGLSPSEGRLFALHPAAVCTLGYERETAVLVHWNVSLRKAGS
jgi:broad specificity phosphatase PhoE